MEKKRKRRNLLSSALESFTNSRATVSYPSTPLKLPPEHRGAVMLLAEKCVGCGLCARDCPAKALVLEKKSRGSYRLVHYPANCAYCGQCEESCVHHAIYHSNDLIEAVTDLGQLVVVLKEQRDDS